MVSAAAIVSMIVFGVFCLLLPFFCFFVLKRNGKVPVKPMIVGAIIFLVFSQILEGGINFYVYNVNAVTKDWMKNIWMFAAFGALMAGLFEEIGRFFGFNFLLRHNRDRKAGLAYGLGHGGIEAILIGTLSSINNLLFSLWINAGTFAQNVGAKLPAATATALKQQLVNTPWNTYDLRIWERAIAFIIHLALSLLVLSGIRNRKSGVLFLAIFLHALVDFPSALFMEHVIPILPFEGILTVFGIFSVWYIVQTKTWNDTALHKEVIANKEKGNFSNMKQDRDLD